MFERSHSILLTSRGFFFSSLTDLQLSLDPSFASFPKGHLSLIVLGHDINKLPGQNCVLEQKKRQQTKASAYRSKQQRQASTRQRAKISSLRRL